MVRVLVVDDSETQRFSTVRLLSSLGHEVYEACDGTDALAKVIESQFSILLMDYHMPRLNGSQCAAKIRRLEKERGTRTPLICMTAEELDDIYIGEEMDGFLSKECSKEELQEIIMRWASPTHQPNSSAITQSHRE